MSRIPLTFHFSYFRGATNWAWTDVHTLCIRSCIQNAKAQKIVIHYDRPGDGAEWAAVIALGNIIELRNITVDTTINSHAVKDQRLWADVHRLRTLYAEGGFYCDLDFIFLKSFEYLRDYPAVIGTQCKQKQKLNCALLGCTAGSTFINAYLGEYTLWTPAEEKKIWTYANIVPWKLSQVYPVHILPRNSFYPLAWSNKIFWKGGKICLKNSVAIHLWENLHPTLSHADLEKTILKDVLVALDGVRPGIVNIGPATTLTFD